VQSASHCGAGATLKCWARTCKEITWWAELIQPGPLAVHSGQARQLCFKYSNYFPILITCSIIKIPKRKLLDVQK
jgi:hypothetical protein